MMKFKIRKGDKVIITSGKDKGKTGNVINVIRAKSKVLVSGVNVVKKHTKPSATSEGGIISKEMPLHISNVAHVDPKSGKATKISFRILKDGEKVRVAKLSGEVIPSEGKK